MNKIIDWFFEKGHNGSLSKYGGEVLRLIGMSKFIDGALFVGTNNGLAPLFLKSEMPNLIIDVMDENPEKIKGVFEKAKLNRINILKQLPQYNYDLVYFEKESDELETLKHIAGKLIPEAFIICAGFNPSDAFIQCFIDQGVRNAKAYKKVLVGDLTIIKL
jgi:hypothetical protein